MQRINLVTLTTKQFPIIKKRGNYTRISLILIIFLLRILKREIIETSIKEAQRAVDEGREIRSDFKLIAKYAPPPE